jgi:methylenetetrahydrofolate--tRNA-(uracil-5-)-methyltransferase
VTKVHVAGGGLAGCEASWQIAERGVPVVLHEMRPLVGTEAHKTSRLAELVCSNSFKSLDPITGAGLLKRELRELGSLLIRIAESVSVPAGTALCVNREEFSAEVERVIASHPLIEVEREEICELPDPPSIVATGPLTSRCMADAITGLAGRENLFFFDAISPIVDGESIDLSGAFVQSRYGKGDGGYLNLPLSREEFARFIKELLDAEVTPLRDFEKQYFFEGCLPIEEMARRGPETLAFGPMKPVGLLDPKTGARPYAAVQLRPENREKTMYSLVGFQTKLKQAEQRRVLRMIPGLENATFLRFGSVHRNTYLSSPGFIGVNLECLKMRGLFFAGQIIGCEGYSEAIASGLYAGINVVRALEGKAPVIFPRQTALGSLVVFLTTPVPHRFQPTNFNFGLLPPLAKQKRPAKEKRELLSRRAEESMKPFVGEVLA